MWAKHPINSIFYSTLSVRETGAGQWPTYKYSHPNSNVSNCDFGSQ